jgi:hypothetical protein
MKESDSLVMTYVFLAVFSVIFGIVLVFVVLLACQYLGIDISKNWWILAIPVTLAVTLNIVLIELYDKYKKR